MSRLLLTIKLYSQDYCGEIEKYIPKSNIWETVKRSTATEEEEFKFEALCTFGKKYHPEPREHKTIMNRCGKM